MKSIEADQRYKVDDQGNVYSYGGIYKLKPCLSDSGYFRIEVRIGGRKMKLLIHRLVAVAFVPNPDKKPLVNHINGVKTDNRAVNLEWVTNSENMRHAVKAGLITYVSGSNGITGRSNKRKVDKYSLKGEYLETYESVLSAKRLIGIQIKGALSGRYKTAGGFVWKYHA